MNTRDTVHLWLVHQSADARAALKKFTNGGFLFIAGMMCLVFLNLRMPDSILKEILALAGLILTIVGAALALWGYLCISVFKILVYVLERKTKNDNSN